MKKDGDVTLNSLRLDVNVSGLNLKYPLMVASGILAVNLDLMMMLSKVEGVGAIVTKSVTINPRSGYSNPVIAGNEHFIINAMGLPNPGYKVIALEIKELLKRLNSEVKVIASIAASSSGEAIVMSEELEKSGVHALELNLSCPHAKGLGIEVSQDLKAVREIVGSVVSTTKIPVFVKVGYSDNVIEVSKVSQDVGANGIVAINTIRGVVIDVYAKKPVLSNVYGGVSGPCIKPIAIGVIYRLYEELTVPIIGCGGVDSWTSAIEMFLAGASAVQIGSAISYKGLNVFKEIIDGIRNYMLNEGFKNVSEIIGLAHETRTSNVHTSTCRYHR